MTPVVALSGVSRVFPGTPPIEAVRDVNLVIEPNDYVSVVGPSGSGKSTLLHLLGLLDKPTSGVYELDGIDTGGLTEQQRAGLRGRRIGFVFQAFHLMNHRSVLENVMLTLVHNGVRGIPRPSRADRAELAVTALESVGLGHRLTSSPATLSGGERQRVAIARALVGSPSLLLADEPTGNLDTTNSEAVMDLFDKLNAQGMTLVVITHNEKVSRRASRCVEITDGQLAAADP